MNDHLWEGLQPRTRAATLLLVLLLTSCIQEATWIWTGDIPPEDAPADHVTMDGTGDIAPADLPGADTDVPVQIDTTDVIETVDTDTDTEQIDSVDIDVLPGPKVLVVVPAVYSGESSGGKWTLRPRGPVGAPVGQPSTGGQWTLSRMRNDE